MRKIFRVLAVIGMAFLVCLSLEVAAKALPSIDAIVVHKAKRRLEVFREGKLIKAYHVSLGFTPQGHKVQEGDGRTPEGKYVISAKNDKSKFHLSLKISYPSLQDKANARAQGVSPGGDIMIHGFGKPYGKLGKLHLLSDWTLGCIALTNEEIEELFAATKVGTPVDIRP